MAIYHEIFKRSQFSTARSHTCREHAEPKVKNPLVECWTCRDDKQAVQIGDMTYINSYEGSRIQATGERVYAVTHEGLVIADRERNYSDDSDFYAVCWNPTTKSLDTITYATTRFGGTDHNYVTKDLAPEHQAGLREYYIEQTIKAIESSERHEWREAATEALRPRKGVIARVVKGRKVPIGIEGLVIWSGESAYGPRIGLVPNGAPDPVWTATSNVTVLVDPDDLPYLEDFTSSSIERRMKAEASVDANKSLFHRGAWIIP